MTYFIAIVVASITLTLANSAPSEVVYDIAKDQNPGAQLTLGVKDTLYQGQGHTIEGTAYGSKHVQPSGPLTAGGEVKYSHISGHGANVAVQKTPSYGTDYKANYNYNFFSGNKGQTSLDGVLGVQGHSGGPFPHSRPEGYAGLKFEHHFPNNN